MEQTLILLKPDAVDRSLVGEVISRFEKKGLKIVGMKMVRMTPELSKEHYAHITTKPFYPDIESFITSKPLVALVLEGKEVVEVVRLILGPTNSRKAQAGTIRGDLSNSPARNIVHASDSVETAEKEIKRFFKKEELFDYPLSMHGSLYAGDE